MKKGPKHATKHAINSKGPGESWDGDIWKDIVEQLTTKHGINEYNLNRIITFSFPTWGKRWHFSLAGKASVERAESLANHDSKWVYTVNSRGILESLMGWKRFSTVMDRAIRVLKPHLTELDQLWSARTQQVGNLTLSGGDSCKEFEMDMWDTYNSDDTFLYVDLNNLLYGEYDDDDRNT